MLDRRIAYAFWALAFYTEQHVDSWAREGREWPPELANEEVIDVSTYVEYLFEGGLTQEEPDPDGARPHDTAER